MDYTGLALFTDLDGTLFDSCRRVSPRNRAALARFQQGGGLFGVSTGRSPMNALSFLPKIPINAWSVVLNGAEAYHFRTGTVAFPRVLPQLRMATFLRLVLEKMPEMDVLLCSESRLFFLSRPETVDQDLLISHQPSVFTGLGKALGYPWLKVVFCSTRPRLEDLKAEAQRLGVLEVVDPVYSSPRLLEFLPRGVNKGRCLRDLRCLDAMKDCKMIAVGDYTNDLELLAEADVAVAVGNALPEVKAAADFVTVSNDEDAIAQIIEEILPGL